MILAILDNGNRIFNYIEQHPGCFLRQIKNDLELSMGTTQYHLYRLTRSDKIISIKKRRHKHYFVKGRFYGDNGLNILQVISQETAREILLYIIEKRNPNQSDLVERFGIAPPSVIWHIKRLIEFGLITENRSGKYKTYSLVADREVVITLVKDFKPGIWDRWSSRLTDTSLSFEG